MRDPQSLSKWGCLNTPNSFHILRGNATREFSVVVSAFVFVLLFCFGFGVGSLGGCVCFGSVFGFFHFVFLGVGLLVGWVF